MKYKLRNSFIRRTGQVKKWQSLFLVVGAFAVVVVLYQQHLRFKHQMAVLVVFVVVGHLWSMYRVLNLSLSSAEKISLELGEREIILGHPHGENRINYSSIEKVEISQQEWPKLLLTLNDKQSVELQGFEHIEAIAESLLRQIK